MPDGNATPTRLIRRQPVVMIPMSPTLTAPQTPQSRCYKTCLLECDIWNNECTTCVDKPISGNIGSQQVFLNRFFGTALRKMLKSQNYTPWHTRFINLIEAVSVNDHNQLETVINSLFEKGLYLVNSDIAPNMVMYASQMICAFEGYSGETRLKLACIMGVPTVITKTYELASRMNDALEMQAHLKCPVCLDTVCDAVITTCSHWFCKTCFDASQAHNNICPLCRTDTFAVPCDRLIGPMRNSFKVQDDLLMKVAYILIQYTVKCSPEVIVKCIVPLLIRINEQLPTVFMEHFAVAMHTMSPTCTMTLRKYYEKTNVSLIDIYFEIADCVLDHRSPILTSFSDECLRFFPRDSKSRVCLSKIFRRHAEHVAVTENIRNRG